MIIGASSVNRGGSASAETGWTDISAEAIQTQYQAGVPDPGLGFFPNGLYFITGGAEDAGAIETLHDAGFTAAIGSGRWDPATYVDAARGTNVRIIIDQSQAAHGSLTPYFNEEWFQRYKADPQVIGWLLYDEPLGIAKYVCGSNPSCTEPDLDTIEQIRTIYDTHKDETDQLLFVDEQALTGHETWPDVLTLTDAGAHYLYPKYYPQAPETLEPIAAAVEQQTSILNGAQPSWFIPQAFCCDLFGAYFPRPEKVNAQAFTAIIHGATGLLHFAWDSKFLRLHGAVGTRPNTPVSYDEGQAATEAQANASRALWQAMNTEGGADALNRQLLALTDALLSPTSTRPYTVEVADRPISATPIRTLLKEHDGALYLLLANIDDAPIQTRLAFDQAYHLRELFTDQEQLGAVASALTSTFQPFETRVYRLSSCLDPNRDGGVDASDVEALANGVGAKAGFSDAYEIGLDYSGNGVLDWMDAQVFIDETSNALPSCAPCVDSDRDGFSDCQEYFVTGTPCSASARDLDGDGLGNAAEREYGTDVCGPDTDGDGCADGREVGPNEILAGQRDPLQYWDFFDTPKKTALGDWMGDKVIDVDDIMGLAQRFAARGAPGNPLTQPVTDTGYHPTFDRRYMGPKPWGLDAGEGAVGLDEIFLILDQFGHSCV
jgi:hypothetical protein